MKAALIIVSAVSGVLAIAVIAGALMLTSLRGQVHQDHLTMQTASRQLTALTARATGQHRDLITCQDWHRMSVPITGVDSAGGTLSAWANPPPLPAHCING